MTATTTTMYYATVAKDVKVGDVLGYAYWVGMGAGQAFCGMVEVLKVTAKTAVVKLANGSERRVKLTNLYAN